MVSIVDPSVLGGIVVQIGDTVIDGSVRHRLGQLRESFESCPPIPLILIAEPSRKEPRTHG